MRDRVGATLWRRRVQGLVDMTLLEMNEDEDRWAEQCSG